MDDNEFHTIKRSKDFNDEFPKLDSCFWKPVFLSSINMDNSICIHLYIHTYMQRLIVEISYYKWVENEHIILLFSIKYTCGVQSYTESRHPTASLFQK